MRFVPCLLALATLSLATSALSAETRSREAPGAVQAMEPAAADLLARLQGAQRTTQTMTAAFRQVKEDALFAEPSIQSGEFTFQRPSRFRWDYEKPEHVIVTVTEDTFQRYLPEQKLARRLDLSKNKRRLFNYFGIGSDVDVFKKHFDLHANLTDTTVPGTKKLEMRGKRRRVQKRLSLLEMWLDERTWLPVSIKVTMADGSTTLWEFKDVAVNPTLPPTTFDLRVPKGTIVQSEDSPDSPLVNELLEDDEQATQTTVH
jgi:outer membrane lipoprotein carrier protein